MPRRWCRPSWFAVFLLLAGLAFFLSLGFWQLRRAAEKQQLLDSFAEAAQAPAVDFKTVAALADPLRFPHVSVTGRYLPARGYLLDEQVRTGRVGRSWIGVFAPRDSATLLLVNRGWRDKAAAGDSPPPPTNDEVRLQGIYAPVPSGGLRMGGNALAQQASWPKLTLYLDAAAIEQDLGVAVYPRLLLLDDESGSGFLRVWTPQILPPQRHRGYALQWFSFALAALVIFAVLHFKKDNELKKQ